MANPITEILVTEFRKPKDDRNFEGLATWLETIPGPNGNGLALFEALSTVPDNMARVSIGMHDPRLVDPQTWPGVVEFFAYLREQARQAEAEAQSEERREP